MLSKRECDSISLNSYKKQLMGARLVREPELLREVRAEFERAE